MSKENELFERLDSLKATLKSICKNIEKLEHQVRITNGRVNKNEMQIALMKNTNELRHEYERSTTSAKADLRTKLQIIPRDKLIIFFLLAIFVTSVIGQITGEQLVNLLQLFFSSLATP